MIASVVRSYLEREGLPLGTFPENYVAMRLHRWGVSDVLPQHKVGKYRLDFAFPDLRLALEVDGPHHWRPDVAIKDVARDAWLRNEGWLVLRIGTESIDDQLLRVVEVVHALRQSGAR